MASFVNNATSCECPSPRALGYSLPPEWSQQQSVMLSCPINPATWPNTRPALERAYAAFAAAITRFEDLRLNCVAGAQEHYRSLLADAGADLSRVRFHDLPTNDAWCRDHGPIILRHADGQRRAVLDFDYNAWGGKFTPWDLDDAVPRAIAAMDGLPCFHAPLFCEGGALEVNGRGTLLTTASVVLNPNRNPGMSKARAEQLLMDALGCEQVLWLPSGLAGDDTDGHIDTITRFIAPDVVLTAYDDDPLSPNHDVLKRNDALLRAMRLHDGTPLEVIRLPMPEPIRPQNWREEILPATYANFLVINNAVIVPTYRQDRRDEQALTIIAQAFPSREIVPSDCYDIVIEGGALHCLSQQMV